MVSKTLLVACVALLCAQAFAYPREEETALGGIDITCIKDVIASFSMIKEFGSIVTDVQTIMANTNAAKAACTGDAAAIAACQREAMNKEVADLIGEVTKVGTMVASDLPKFEQIFSECF